MPRGKKPKKEPELSLAEELTSSEDEKIEEKEEETPISDEKKDENVKFAGLKEMPKLLVFSDGTLKNTTIIVDGKKINFSDFHLESDSAGGVLKLKYQRNVEITL